MAERSMGWVQNPASFENLKNVISTFVKDSTMYNLVKDRIKRLVLDEELKENMLESLGKLPNPIKYSLLKGKGVKAGQKREDAACSGIIQATIENQKGREYTDDWTADGFLRWGISIGLLDYDEKKDTVSLNELGKLYIDSKDEEKEKEILIIAFLSYPPAVRILELLSNGEHLTKFEIGKNLGGLGEAGFTSIPQDLFIQAIYLAKDQKEKAKLRTDTEGSADKYARMISSWLCKVGLLQKLTKEVTTEIGDNKYSAKIGQAYKITLKGLKELKKSRGTSSKSKISKIVYWEMLATKVKDRDYIRNRRAYIIKSIENKTKTLEEIKNFLETKNLKETEITIKDELVVIEAMGINILKNKDTYIIKDKILKLNIPFVEVKKTNILELKDKVRQKLKYLNHRYISLIDLAYDSKANRDFEIQTIDLLTNELAFKGARLGESRKPDGIISYLKYGVILDNKAYSNGYNLPINQADEMIRYIEENQKRDKKLNKDEWWKNFEASVEEFNFLFVTSFLKGNFENNLKYIYERTKVSGGAINIENLLYFAEKIKAGEIKYTDIFKYFKNKEVNYEDKKG